MTAAAQITISEETLDLLRKMGHEGESDDEIIRRLIRERSIVSLDEHWNQILDDDEFLPLEEL
jgi:predicted CopG family antitoxin